MSDRFTDDGSADQIRINVFEEYEMKVWTETFGCTISELLDAIKEVGVSAKAVAAYLKKKSRATIAPGQTDAASKRS